MTKYYPPGCDTPELRRIWERRLTPIHELLPDLLADADLPITVRPYLPTGEEFAHAWSEAVSQPTDERSGS